MAIFSAALSRTERMRHNNTESADFPKTTWFHAHQESGFLSKSMLNDF
jgi:hypothetical protein